MWKLFVFVLIMSDTGDISSTGFNADFPTEKSCQAVLASMTKSAERTMQGHKVTITATGNCFPPEQQLQQGIPPQLLGLIDGVLGQVRRDRY